MSLKKNRTWVQNNGSIWIPDGEEDLQLRMCTILYSGWQDTEE